MPIIESREMKTVETKEFSKQLSKLSRGGGKNDLVYREAVTAIQNWKNGKSPGLKTTDNGESRIRHAIKYHLAGFFRLVTTEHDGVRILLFIGKHDDVEEWLDKHRGYEFAINASKGVKFIPATAITTLPDEPPQSVPFATGPLLDRLSPKYLDRLKLSPILLSALRTLTFEKIDDGDNWLLLNALQYESLEQQITIIETLRLLAQGLTSQAEMRIDLFTKEAVLASENPQVLLEAIDNGNASDELLDLSRFSQDELGEIYNRANYHEWMLYLHPSQSSLTTARTTGPARLVGVSGSGKTCVLVHRARTLARRYPGERILILVLNESLKYLIENLITQLCSKEEKKTIFVKRIYEYCYEVIKAIKPAAKIEARDNISGEDLGKCWSDFTKKPHAEKRMTRLEAPLSFRDVDPKAYLFDELIWIRTGFGFGERHYYLTCERTGRGLKIPKFSGKQTQNSPTTSRISFPNDARKIILGLLTDYEEYMREGGLLDEDGVALDAYEVREQIAERSNLRYRCVLVDEVQDCSTTQLAVIKSISTSETDGLYLVGDPVQKVFPRQQHLLTAGIDIRGNATILRVNYRNTRQVLEAAYQIIDAFRENCPVSQSEILRPEFAFREGPKPKLVVCENLEEQYRCVESHLGTVRAVEMGTACVATITGSDLEILDEICSRNAWSIRNLNSRSTFEEVQQSVMRAHFEDMKGHEFRFVYLLNLNDRSLLQKSIPPDERWRIAFQLYVAMTRAQDELMLFSVGKSSSIIEPLLPYVDILAPQDILT
jgi:hypothetical protein